MDVNKRKEVLSDHRACRFCLTKDGLRNIHDNNIQTPKKSIPFGLKVLACIAVEIFPSDRMPPFVCSRCKFFMELFYEFKQICRKADVTISNYLKTEGATPLDLEPVAWSSSLVKLFRLVAKPKVVKTTVEGAMVEVTSHDVSDSEDDTENVYKVKVEDDSANIKVVTDIREQPFKNKAKRGSPDAEESASVQPAAAIDDGCWSCDQCECTYPLQQLLELHKMQKHRDRMFNCDICDSKFYSKSDLASHSWRHSDELPYHCSACDRKFRRLKLLKRHEEMDHQDLPRWGCTNCPMTFLSEDLLEKHQRRNRCGFDQSYPCGKCNKVFRYKATLDRHTVAMHASKLDLLCQYCPERFPTVAKLTRHVRSHAGDRPYPCKYCDKSFTKSHHYTRHLRVKHPLQDVSELDQYPCEQCTDTFNTQDELIYHSAIHATQNLTCPLCQEKFLTVDDVTSHIKSHVNGMEFMCEFCELVFTSKQKLDAHSLAAHEDELRDLDDSSMSMDAEDLEASSINVQDEGDHIAIEIKKPDGFLIQTTSKLEKMDTSINSEESEPEVTLGMDTSDVPKALVAAVVAKAPSKPVEAFLEKLAVIKSDLKVDKVASPLQTAILKKAEVVKAKTPAPEPVATITKTPVVAPVVASVVEPVAAFTAAPKKDSTKDKAASGNDKSLRLLEKELQDLQRTNSRTESTKAPAKAVETIRNRRPQLTSTPKPRAPEERKTPTTKSPAIEKKVLERRAVKENKEPKEKESKNNNGSVREGDSKLREDKESKAKEDKEAKKEESAKDKSAVKNGSGDKSVTEETPTRRSSRPSKIKDYAKMIRVKEDSDDSEDDDEEYEEEKVESRPKPRRSSIKPQKGAKASPAPADADKPAPRKRGRPRKDAQDVPAKLKKEDTTEEESQPETELDVSKTSEKKDAQKEKTAEKVVEKVAESADANASEEKQPSTEVKKVEAKTPPTLKKVPVKSLPPGVKPLPLPPHVRPTELCEMQIGQKMVKVQKIIMNKATVEDMAKKGYLEMKGGTMVLKPGIKLDQKGIAIVGGGTEPSKESPTNTEKPVPMGGES